MAESSPTKTTKTAGKSPSVNPFQSPLWCRSLVFCFSVFSATTLEETGKNSAEEDSTGLLMDSYVPAYLIYSSRTSLSKALLRRSIDPQCPEERVQTCHLQTFLSSWLWATSLCPVPQRDGANSCRIAHRVNGLRLPFQNYTHPSRLSSNPTFSSQLSCPEVPFGSELSQPCLPVGCAGNQSASTLLHIFWCLGNMNYILNSLSFQNCRLWHQGVLALTISPVNIRNVYNLLTWQIFLTQKRKHNSNTCLIPQWEHYVYAYRTLITGCGRCLLSYFSFSLFLPTRAQNELKFIECSLCVPYYSKHCAHINSQAAILCPVILPTLQIEKLRYKEVKNLVQSIPGHKMGALIYNYLIDFGGQRSTLYRLAFCLSQGLTRCLTQNIVGVQ